VKERELSQKLLKNCCLNIISRIIICSCISVKCLTICQNKKQNEIYFTVFVINAYNSCRLVGISFYKMVHQESVALGPSLVGQRRIEIMKERGVICLK